MNTSGNKMQVLKGGFSLYSIAAIGKAPADDTKRKK